MMRHAGRIVEFRNVSSNIPFSRIRDEGRIPPIYVFLPARKTASGRHLCSAGVCEETL